MVDRITPKTPSDISGVPLKNTAVIAEGFKQFVIEDKFSMGWPALEKAGVEFVEDAEPFYLMQLTLLNGTHTVIGLIASQLKITYVHQCFSHAHLARFLKKLIRDEFHSVIPKDISAERLEKYQDTILQRLSNTNIQDQVSRLTCDLTRKIKKYIFPAIEQGMRNGASVTRLVFVVAAWILFQSGMDGNNTFHFQDSQSALLGALKSDMTVALMEGHQTVQMVLKSYASIFDRLANSAKFAKMLHDQLITLKQFGTEACLEVMEIAQRR